MVSFILGEAGNSKTTCMTGKICEAAKQSKTVYVIIPEQFSYEFERKLYNELGSRLFNRVNVLSFTRLAKLITDRYGGESGEYADENTKIAVMYLALEKIKNNKSLMYFNKQIQNSDFINSSLEIISGLRRASVSPQSLSEAVSTFDEKARPKAEDIALIYSVYDSQLSDMNFKDGLNDITLAAASANMNDMFIGAHVFIDEFESFSPDELQMLEVMISEAEEFVITLCTPDIKAGDFSLFATVNSTYYKLCHIAAKYSVQINEIMLDKCYRYDNEALETLSRSIARNRSKPVDSSGCVSITEARDIYDEAEFVCASIKEMVMTEGIKYGQICITSRQLEDYSLILEETMKKYDIPYFIDTEKSVMHTSLVLYITSLLRLIGSRKLSSQLIFRYAKTGLTQADLIETSVLENYCYQWDIDGEMWERPFTLDADSEEAEQIRQKIAVPLIKLREKCDDIQADEMCPAVYEFLREQGVIDKTADLIAEYKANGLNDMASEINRLWGCICDILEVISRVIGTEKISAEDFRDIFTVMLRQASFLSPPQRLDIVSVVSAQKARLNQPAVTFVMGVNEGIMPFAEKTSGILSDSDINAFADAEIDIAKDTKRLLLDERFIVYRVFSSASHKLFITYPLSDSMGGARYPSYLISQVKHMFSNNISGFTSDRDILFYSSSPEAAYFNYVQHYFDKTSVSRTLREVLMKTGDYAKKISYLDNVHPDADHWVNDSELLRQLIGDRLEISATSFQEYNLCHFKYFCNHALCIRPRRKKEYSTMESGNLIHMCLENLLRECPQKEQLMSLTHEMINSKISGYADEYRRQQLGGDYRNSVRMDAKYEKFTEDISLLVEHLQKELAQSKFYPDRFEFVLSEKNGTRPLKITTDSGIEIILNGKIDRIDKYVEDNQTYIRIIDYKTGSHSFSLTKVMFGIDMQLLLYLFSVTGPDGYYKNSIPAGILYMPSGKIPLERDRDDNDRKDEYLNKYYHMNGMVLKELPVLSAMEEDIEGVYIPARLTAQARKTGAFVLDKTKTSALTRKQIQRLREHADRLLRKMADDLFSGDISASPLITGNETEVCSFCDYWDVCGNVPRIREKVIPDDAKENAQKMIGGDE